MVEKEQRSACAAQVHCSRCQAIQGQADACFWPGPAASPGRARLAQVGRACSPRSSKATAVPAGLAPKRQAQADEPRASNGCSRCPLGAAAAAAAAGQSGEKEGPKMIDEYCKDLCAEVRLGRIDPVRACSSRGGVQYAHWPACSMYRRASGRGYGRRGAAHGYVCPPVRPALAGALLTIGRAWPDTLAAMCGGGHVPATAPQVCGMWPRIA